MSQTPPFQYVDSNAGLLALCEHLATQPWLAIDTEFLREKTYRPQLALVQIAADDGTVACIDPLAIDNLGPLQDLLYQPYITKVLHAAGQDLEIFYWMMGRVPDNLFDTQIAAPLLGHQEQLGYANLVRDVLGIELEKSHARADWMRRPLPEKQLQYAADDVIYLARMYPLMQQQLAELDRLEWLQQEWIDLTDPDLYEKPADQMWRRVKQIDRLKGARLSIAQELASWRETTAREQDLPRSWLLKDPLILDLARQMPDEIGELKHIRGLSDGTIRRHGGAIVSVINEARDKPPQPVTTKPRKQSLSNNAEAAVDVLTAVVKLHAAELNINPAILAPKKALEDLLRGKNDTILDRGWRQKLIGQTLRKLMQGGNTLRISDGKLMIDPATIESP